MARGIDGDLDSCLSHNPQGFKVDDIELVKAVIVGEHDGPNWHWLLQLKDGSVAYLTGGCDYTGWDCRSSAESEIHDKWADALAAVKDGNDRQELARQLQKGRAQNAEEQIQERLQTYAEAPR
jgi:hypothetical protein